MGAAVLRAVGAWLMRCAVWQVDPVHLTPYYDAALCRALAAGGWSVRLFTSPYLYDRALAPPQGYAVEYPYGRWLNRRGWLDYPQLRRALRTSMYLVGHRRLLTRLEKSPPDVVHIQWSRLPTVDCWLIAQIRRRGIPVVQTVHDVEPLFGRAAMAELEALYAVADRLVVHTSANRDMLLRRYPRLQEDRVRVIPHIAVPFPVADRAGRERARRELGIPLDAPVILFFGTARPYKGLDRLVDAYRRALRERSDLWLVIAGLQPKYGLLTNLGGQVVLHDAYIPSDRAWAYHLAADMSVFPYCRVSQSGALITAMGFGLPAIVTDVGGLPETIDGNGWVVPRDSTDALSTALVEAASDVERLRRMGEHSRRLIRERHASELIAARTVAVYEEVVSACSGSHT